VSSRLHAAVRAVRVPGAMLLAALLAVACGGDSPNAPPTGPVAGVLAAVSVSLTDASMQLGQTTQASVMGKDGFGTAVPLGTRPVSWSSSNTVVATVSATGVVTGVGIGTTNIQASVADGSTARTSNAAIAVTGIAGAPITADVVMPGLTFSPFETLVKQGGTVRFIFPALAHNVFWDPRLTGSPAAPADINTTTSATVSRTFPSAGVFTYKCTLHPGMDGTIIVSP
jgi:plastocyanin